MTHTENIVWERREYSEKFTYNLQFQVVVRRGGVYSEEDGLRDGSDEPEGEGVPLGVRTGGGMEVVLDQSRLAPPLVCGGL